MDLETPAATTAAYLAVNKQDYVSKSLNMSLWDKFQEQITVSVLIYLLVLTVSFAGVG